MSGLDRLVDWLIAGVHLLQFWEVVDQYETAVVLRLGRYHRELGPGLHPVWPLGIERVISDDSVPAALETGTQSLTTADGVPIAVNLVMMWEITDMQSFSLKVEGRESVLASAAQGVLSEAVASSDWDEVRTRKFLRSVAARIRGKAQRMGVRVFDVRAAEMVKCRPVRLIQE